MPRFSQGDWLLVAPATELYNAQDEVMRVANSLNAELLIGENVNLRSLQDALQEKRIGVWVVTHGDEYGIQLSDGMMSSDILTPLLETSGAEIAYINTCRSLNLGVAIQNRILLNFVTNLQDVPDHQAFVSGTSFAHHLATGKSYYAAYLASRPNNNRNLVFLAGAEARMSNYHDRDGDLAQKVDAMRDELKRITIMIDGDRRYGQEGLTVAVQKLTDQIETIQKRVLQAVLALGLTSFLVTAIAITLAILIFMDRH